MSKIFFLSMCDVRVFLTFGADLTTVLPVLFKYCCKYCNSDSRKLWAVMKGGGGFGTLKSDSTHQVRVITVFSFPVVDWFCLFIYLWVLTFPLLDCSEFGNFVITLINRRRFFRNQLIRNKNCLWQPCLLTDRDKMSYLYRGPSIDASYQVSVHLAKWFQRRRVIFLLTEEKLF